jgi:hypothetical protein
MSRNTLALTGGVAACGLFYTWRQQRENEAQTQVKEIVPRVLTPSEKNYLGFMLGKGSVTTLLSKIQSIIKDDYFYDIGLGFSRVVANELNQKFSGYLSTLSKASRLWSMLKRNSGNNVDRVAFFQSFIKAFTMEGGAASDSPDSFVENAVRETMQTYLERGLEAYLTPTKTVSEEDLLKVCVEAGCTNVPTDWKAGFGADAPPQLLSVIKAVLLARR